MSKKLGVVIRIITFLTIFMVLDYIIGINYNDPTGIGNRQARLMLHDLYSTEKIDIAFCGSSNMYSAIDPKIIEKELEGYIAFDLCTSSAMPIESYYSIKEMIRTNKKPKIVCFDAFFPAYQKSKFYDTYEHSIYLYDNLEFSLNKVNYFFNAFESSERLLIACNTYRFLQGKSLEDLCNKQGWLRYKVTNPEYRKYNAFDNEDEAYGGNGYRYLKSGIEDGKGGTEVYSTWDADNVNEDAVYWLKKSIDLCKKNDIIPIFVSIPLHDVTLVGMKNYDEVHDFFDLLAEETGITYYDLNYAKQELLQLEDGDFADQHHLSQRGAEKVSAFLAKMLGDEQESTFLLKNYEEVQNNNKRVAGATLTVDENRECVIANAIFGECVQPLYCFYESKNEKEWKLVARTMDNKVELKPQNDYYMKVIVYNSERTDLCPAVDSICIDTNN